MMVTMVIVKVLVTVEVMVLRMTMTLLRVKFCNCAKLSKTQTLSSANNSSKKAQIVCRFLRGQ